MRNIINIKKESEYETIATFVECNIKYSVEKPIAIFILFFERISFMVLKYTINKKKIFNVKEIKPTSLGFVLISCKYVLLIKFDPSNVLGVNANLMVSIE
jgi:hypothetical protein